MNFTPGPDNEFLDKDIARLVGVALRERKGRTDDRMIPLNENEAA